MTAASYSSQGRASTTIHRSVSAGGDALDRPAICTGDSGVFTARRNARIASAVLATAIPSVCLFVRPSVTRRYYVKTTARSTVQFAPLDSKMCLVL